MQKIKQAIQNWLGITEILNELNISSGMLNYTVVTTIENQHKIHDLMYPPVKVKSVKEKKGKAITKNNKKK